MDIVRVARFICYGVVACFPHIRVQCECSAFGVAGSVAGACIGRLKVRFELVLVGWSVAGMRRMCVWNASRAAGSVSGGEIVACVGCLIA